MSNKEILERFQILLDCDYQAEDFDLSSSTIRRIKSTGKVSVYAAKKINSLWADFIEEQEYLSNCAWMGFDVEDY